MKMEAAILAILLAASMALAAEPVKPANNAPAPAVTVQPMPHSAHPDGPCCGCQPAHARGSVLHRLIAWATYCPKERIGCCQSCNTCSYKGALPIYLLFLNPACKEGSGLHPTLPPDCCHGHKRCTKCANCCCK